MEKTYISLIIPVFNEEENLDELCEILDSYAKTSPFGLELVFVDDGSKDGTLKKLKETDLQNAKKIIVSFSKNFGSHAAIRAGFKEATSPYAMTFLADLQDPVELIGRMYGKLTEENLQSVFAARGEKADHCSKSESFFSRLYSFCIRKFAVKEYPPRGFNNFMITRKLMDIVNENMELNSSIHLQILDMGFAHAFIECDYLKRKRGASKWSYAKKIKLWIDSFVSFSFVPIRVISLFGIVLALIGFLYALFIIITKVFNIFDFESGFPTLIASVMIGFGVTNLSLGIVAEYLWRTFDAARKRPLFIIDEIIREDDRTE